MRTDGIADFDGNRVCDEFARSLKAMMARRWEHGEAETPIHLEKHAMRCTRCRARLSAALIVIGRRQLVPHSPPGLGAKIMDRIRGAESCPVVAIERGRSPRATRVRRFVAVAAAAALLVVATATITTVIVRSHVAGTVLVRLMLDAPEARRVAVVGDWNAWEPDAQVLTDPDADGVWTIRFRVERAREYQYQFIIDNERWLGDPNAVLQVDDGFGGTNSVLEI